MSENSHAMLPNVYGKCRVLRCMVHHGMLCSPVRSGCFCGHQYVAYLLGISDEDSAEARDRLIRGLPVDLPGMVRASLGLANTKDDIDRLIAGLQAIAQGEIRAQYVKTASGDLEPVGATHEFTAHGERL